MATLGTLRVTITASVDPPMPDPPPTMEVLAAALAASFVRAMAEVDAVVDDTDDRYRDEIEGR